MANQGYLSVGGLTPLQNLEVGFSAPAGTAMPTPAPTPELAPAQAAGSSMPVGGLDSIFSAVEQQFPHLPAGLLKAIAWQESGFNPRATGVVINNPKSAHYGTRAQGMFQFMPATAKQFAVADPFDPMQATLGAARKLTYDLSRHNGVLGEALLDWYGRGMAPAGQPTSHTYVNQVLQKANALRSNGAQIQQPTQQSGETPTVGRTVDGSRLVVNGVVFDPRDYMGWRKAVEASHGPAAPLPEGFQPVAPADFASMAERVMQPKATFGGLAKSFGRGALESAGAMVQPPLQLAAEGVHAAMGSTGPAPFVSNPGTWLAEKTGLTDMSLGDQAALAMTGEAMQRAGKAGGVSEAMTALGDIPGAGAAHLLSQGAGFAVPWLAGGAGLRLAGAGPAATRAAVSAVGALQGAGISGEQIHAQIMAMDEPALIAAFPQYAELRSQGQTVEAARARLAHDAALGAMPGGAVAGGVGGAVYAPWIAGAPRGATSLAARAGNIAGFVPRVAATSGVGAVAGGMQGALQTAAQQVSAEAFTGGNIPMEGMAPNVLMGSMGGAMLGGMHGLRRTALPPAPAPKPLPSGHQFELPLTGGKMREQPPELPARRPGELPLEGGEGRYPPAEGPTREEIDAEFERRQLELPFDKPEQLPLPFKAEPQGELLLPGGEGKPQLPAVLRRGNMRPQMPRPVTQEAVDSEFAARQPELPFSRRQAELPLSEGEGGEPPRVREEALPAQNEMDAEFAARQETLPLEGQIETSPMKAAAGRARAAAEAAVARRTSEEGTLLRGVRERSKSSESPQPTEERPVQVETGPEEGAIFDRLTAAKVGNQVQRRAAAKAIVKALDQDMTIEEWTDKIQGSRSEKTGPALIDAFSWALERRQMGVTKPRPGHYFVWPKRGETAEHPAALAAGEPQRPKVAPAVERAAPQPTARSKHAEEVRSDAGQVPKRGNDVQGREDQGRENLQQPKETKPAAGDRPSKERAKSTEEVVTATTELYKASEKLPKTDDGDAVAHLIHKIARTLPAAGRALPAASPYTLRMLASFNKEGVSSKVRAAVVRALEAVRPIIGDKSVDNEIAESRTMLSIDERGPTARTESGVPPPIAVAMLDRLATSLSNKSGKEWKLLATTKPRTTTADGAEALARLFGKKIVWFRNRTLGKVDINGAVDGDISRDVVFLNVDNKRPYMQVLGHETIHHLAREHPELYKAMVKDVLPLLRNVEEYVKLRQDKMEEAGLDRPTKEKAVEELMADVFGDRLDEPEFWQKVGERSPDILQRVGNAVRAFIQRVISKLFPRVSKTDDMITDMEKVRDIVAEVMAKYVKEGPQETRGGSLELDVGEARRRIHDDFVPAADDIKSFSKKGVAAWKGAMNKARLWYINRGTMLSELSDMAKPYLKSAPHFEDIVRTMSADVNAVNVPASYLINRWGALDSVKQKAMVDLSLLAEEFGFRPDKPLSHASNKWGRENNGTPAEIEAAYKRVVRAFETAPEEVRSLYTESQDINATVITQVRDAMLQITKLGVNDPAKRADIEKQLHDRFDAAADGRPYNPHIWEGDYVLEVNNKTGERFVLAFDTKDEANARAEGFKSDGYSVRRFTKQNWISGEGVGARTFLHGMQEAIERMGLEPEQADTLLKTAQNLYFAGMPEVAGARRLITRKNTPGWSSKYRYAWARGVQSLVNHAARLKHTNALRDTLEDMGREAGTTQPVYLVTSWRAADKSDFLAEIAGSAAERTSIVKQLSKEGRTYHISLSDPRELHDRLPRLLIEQAPSTEVADKWKANLVDAVARAETAHGGEGDTFTAGEYYNAFRSRFNDLLHDTKYSAVANALTNIGYLHYLGMSVPFAFTNLHQVPMVGLPALQASYGYGPAFGTLREALAILGRNKALFAKLAASSLKQTTSDALDVAQLKLPPEEEGVRKMLESLQRYGTLDFTQAHELHALTAGTPQAVERVIKAAGIFAHPTEVFNRALIAIAAYKLKLRETGDHEQATRFARKITDDTQVNYSVYNRAPILNTPTARVVLQFRQFGMHMAWLLGKQVHTIFKGADPVERAAALRYLLGMTAMTTLFAGVRGAPFVGTALMLAHLVNAALGDPDNPVDIEHELRSVFGPLAYNGVYRGMALNISGSLGLADILPGSGGSVRYEAKSRDMLKNILFDAAGPSVGLLGNWMDGVDHIQNANTLRAWEAFMPKAFKGPFMAARFNTEGMETSNGVVRIGPNQFTPLELMAAAMGFKLAKVANMQEQVGTLQRQELLLGVRAAVLRKAYMAALESGSEKDKSEALADIAAFNKQNPSMQINSANLRSFVTMHGRSQAIAGLTHGIAASRKQLLLAEQLGLLDSAE